MSHESVRVVKRVYDAWDEGGLEEAVKQLPDDIVWETAPTAPDPEVVQGSHGAYESMQRWLDQWESLEISDLVLEDFGNQVLASCNQQAVGKSSGAVVESPLHMLWTVRDGRLTRMQMFLDEEEARAAVS
jgi:ketosteroid isomerase-like protein